MPQEGEASTEAQKEPFDQESTATEEGQKPQDGKSSKTFDESYVKELRAEAARHRKEAQEAKAKAQEYEDRDKSELEKLTNKLAKAEQAKTEAETSLLRYQIAAEKQLSAEAAELLTGSTREELEERAERLLSLTKKDEPKPEFDGGAREPAPEAKSPEEQHNDFLVKMFEGNAQQN